MVWRNLPFYKRRVKGDAPNYGLVTAKVKLENISQDGILVENMHDRPYLKPGAVGMETVASMTRVCSEVRRAAPNHPLGIQILTGRCYTIM